MTRNLLFIYLKQTFLHDLEVFNIEGIQNFRMKKLCEWTLYRPGSNSFLPEERFRIDPVCRSVAETNIYNKTNITLSSWLYENMKYNIKLQMCSLFAR